MCLSMQWPARLLEVALAALGLLFTAPLLLLIALAIRLEGPGPLFFAQERLGRGGSPFRLHKFRTLTTSGGRTVTPANSDRETRVGHWLRRWHLDELPQLVDVIRGRMALVGPRPEVPANLEAIEATDRTRLLAVRPGLTGPTQLAFLAEDELLASVADPVAVYRRILVPAKVRHDLDWLASRSLAGDLRVLLATPIVVFSRRARERSRRRLAALIADSGPGPHATGDRECQIPR